MERQQAEEQQKAEKEAQEQAYITKLQQYQATIAALDQCNTMLAQDPPVLPAKVGCGVRGSLHMTYHLGKTKGIKKEKIRSRNSFFSIDVWE